MTPESQSLFSITLFLALSSLLAWSHRHNRNRQLGAALAVCIARSDDASNF
jgi:hypothetical protein